MKASENHKIKEKANKIPLKPFPGKLTQGQGSVI